MSGPAITLVGTLTDFFGNPDPNASVLINLCNYGDRPVRISATMVLTGLSVTAVANAEGFFTTPLWGNDVIVPSGTFYSIGVLDDQGNTVQCGDYKLTGSGIFDLSTLAPYIPNGPVGPSITTAPTNQLVTAPAPATFSVVAAGSAILAYQWKLNGSPIEGANDASYTTGATDPTENGNQYTVTVSNAAGSVTSSPALLGVNAVAPTITTQPLPQTVVAPASATFSVVAAGTAPLSYQWAYIFEDGAAHNIPGATSATYTTSGSEAPDGTKYQFAVAVSNTAGSVISNWVLLTVT